MQIQTTHNSKNSQDGKEGGRVEEGMALEVSMTPWAAGWVHIPCPNEDVERKGEG